MVDEFETAIVIVGYSNPGDVVECLTALARAASRPCFEVFVAENGGPAAFDALVASLTDPGGPCVLAREEPPRGLADVGLRQQRLRLANSEGAPTQFVNVSEMEQNLGYAGGVNAWLRPLMAISGWSSAWVLNPDTAPAPDALAELARYAAESGKGLIGSRLVAMDSPDRVQTRGLRWRKLRATAEAIDFGAPASREPDSAEVERQLDAPSGAATYATRTLISRAGLMSEHYFLCYEDLEWGLRAKALGATLGYAHRSIVYHKGGSTIGTSSRRAGRSKLAAYLEARNSILFVRAQYPRWVLWTVLIGFVQTVLYLVFGAAANARASLEGLLAGIAHEVGRPDDVLAGSSRRIR